MQAPRARADDEDLHPAGTAQVEGQTGADRRGAALRRGQQQAAAAHVEHPPEAPVADPDREVDRVAVVLAPVADLGLAQGRHGAPGEPPGEARDAGADRLGGLHPPGRLAGGARRRIGVAVEEVGRGEEVLRRPGEVPGGRRLGGRRRLGGGDRRAQAGERGRDAARRHRPGAGEAAVEGAHRLDRPGGVRGQELELLRHLPERFAAGPGADGLDGGAEGEAVGLACQGRHRLDEAGGILGGLDHLGLEDAALGVGAFEVAGGLDQHPGEAVGLLGERVGGGPEGEAPGARRPGPGRQGVEVPGEGGGVRGRGGGLGAAVAGRDPDGAGGPHQFRLDPVDGVAPGPVRVALRLPGRRPGDGERGQDLDRVGAVAGGMRRAEAQAHDRMRARDCLRSG